MAGEKTDELARTDADTKNSGGAPVPEYIGVPQRPRSDMEAFMELVDRFQAGEVEKTRMNNETQQLAIEKQHTLEMERIKVDAPARTARIVTTYVILGIAALGCVVGFSIAAWQGQIERAFALLTPILFVMAGRTAKLPGIDDAAKPSKG